MEFQIIRPAGTLTILVGMVMLIMKDDNIFLDKTIECQEIVKDKTAHPLVRIDAASILEWDICVINFLPENTIQIFSEKKLMWISNDLYDGREDISVFTFNS